MSNKISLDPDLSALSDALTQHDVTLPEDYDRVAGGAYGVSIIGTETVLKLFRQNPKRLNEDMPFNPREYFDASVSAFENLDKVAAEITSRGVNVPKLLAHGRFSEPLFYRNQKFYAWQIMTRVYGQPVKYYAICYDRGKNKMRYDTQLREMAETAAKMHIVVDPSGMPSADGPDADLSYYANGDKMMLRLIKALKAHVKYFLKSPAHEVLLHGDYYPSNILDDGGHRGVVDWDQQKVGRPENDLWMLSRRPDRLRSYCHLYNSTAQQPVNERLMVAQGLVDNLQNYLYLSRPRKEERLSVYRRAHDLRVICKRVIDLANHMFHLTGVNVYRETATYLSNSNEAGPRPHLLQKPGAMLANRAPR